LKGLPVSSASIAREAEPAGSLARKPRDAIMPPVPRRQNGGRARKKQAMLPTGQARTEIIMSAEPVVIKQYAGRRLYSPAAGSYLTIDDLGAMVEDEEEFVVYDAKTGEDITHFVLKQIIVERAHHG
jgi:PHB/PHA accumulation regulator DNA-binding domain